MPSVNATLRCIGCGSSLLNDGTSLRCSVCLISFPLIDGIPVMVRRAAQVVAASYHETRDWRKRASRFSEYLLTLDSTASVRAARAAHALRENLLLLPAGDTTSDDHHIRHNPVEGLLDAFATSHNGWSLDELLPYFHQDWGNPRRFRGVAELIRRSLHEHAPARCAVAVLGAAACGLAYNLAADADEVFAVELSLPALRLARRLLQGDELIGYLQGADWRPSHMRRQGPPRDNVRLVVADATSLPFEAGTQDAVITQYLMDAVGNPWSVIDEITRVLRPGGVWVNFSLPFRLPDEPLGHGRPQADELAGTLTHRGLEMVDHASVRFSPVDVSDIYPDAMTFEQAVQFFITCKVATGDNASWHEGSAVNWHAVPRFARGRSVHLDLTQSLSVSGTATHRGMRIGGAVGAFGVRGIGVEDAKLLEDLLGVIDGRRTLREVQRVLANLGHEVSDVQFAELLYYLGQRDGLLMIEAPRI